MAFTTPNLDLYVWNLLSDGFNHEELTSNWQKLDDHDHGANGGVQIGTAALANNAVTNAKMADNAADARVIAAGAVGSSELATNAVATAKVQDGAITNAKLDASLQGLQFQTGMGMPWFAGADDVPDGWLPCDGSAVSRTTYAALFALLGTVYGSGNGTTTFNLPDLRGRTMVAPDGSAGRLDANDALGNSGGTQKHTLTTSEMPSHAHTMDAAGAHTHIGDNGQNILFGSGVPQSYGIGAPDGGHPAQIASGATDSQGSHTHTINSNGSGTAHNNMQPYLVVNMIIKT